MLASPRSRRQHARLVLAALALATCGCKRSEAAACAAACKHAVKVVRTHVESSGEVEPEELREKAGAMRRACEAECGARKLDVSCMEAAERFEDLQECARADEAASGAALSNEPAERPDPGPTNSP